MLNQLKKIEQEPFFSIRDTDGPDFAIDDASPFGAEFPPLIEIPESKQGGPLSWDMYDSEHTNVGAAPPTAVSSSTLGALREGQESIPSAEGMGHLEELVGTEVELHINGTAAIARGTINHTQQLKKVAERVEREAADVAQAVTQKAALPQDVLAICDIASGEVWFCLLIMFLSPFATLLLSSL